MTENYYEGIAEDIADILAAQETILGKIN